MMSWTWPVGAPIAAVLLSCMVAPQSIPQPPSNEHPAWSPTGAWIAFDSDVGGHRQIRIVHPDGTGLRTVAPSASEQVAPQWHPGGTSIAFLRRVDQTFLPYQASLAGDSVVRIDVGNATSMVRWSPRGDLITFVARGAAGSVIRLANADGSGARDLVTAGANNGFAVWAPDGQHLAFASNRSGTRDIYLTDRSGSEPRLLVHSAGNDIPFGFSPDGRQVLFHSDRDADGVFQTMLVDVETGALRRLTSGPHFNGVPSMSPDGRSVVLETGRWGGRDLLVIDLDTGSERRLLR